MKVNDVYKEMIDAANKARDAKLKFGEWNKVLVDNGKTDIERDNDLHLKRYLSQYHFWRREQIRLGELIQTHCMYVALESNIRFNDFMDGAFK